MSSSIRVLVVQPTLAKYRAPVYRELASREGVELELWYGDHDAVPNVEPDGFHGVLKPLRTLRLAGQEALWHAAQVEAARRDDVDVVVLSWGTRYLSLGPACRTARRRGLPVVLWGHGYSKTDNPIRRWARDRIARLGATLLFYDQRTADTAIASGWPSDRVFVAANAIDQQPIAAARDAWTADPGRLAAWRKDHDVEGRRLLLYVSRFRRANRLELLIEAVERLRDDDPNVVAALVGDGEDLPRIEALVAERGVGESVRLLGPIYDESQLAPWFLSAEAFVYPTAIGLSLLHAFGYGLPVVTDDRPEGHHPEIVAYQPDPALPDANGLAYRSGDAADLAATLRRLLDDRGLRDRLGAGARRTIEERFNVPAMVDGMLAAIRRAAELA